MTRVKICGLRRPEDAILAARAGADLIGLIFYPPSHRYVRLEEAREIRAALDTLPEPPALVGVFVNEAPATLRYVADACGLDLVQLSGDEPWSLLGKLSRPSIKVERPVDEEDVVALVEMVGRPNPLSPFPKKEGGTPLGSATRPEAPGSEKIVQGGTPSLLGKGPGVRFAVPQPLIMLDTPVPGAYGGTGRTGDWTVARAAAGRLPVLLSGGLTPENVGEAIRRVRPWGVDVSSGVETNRLKDPAKIEAFLRAARSVEGVEVSA
jgi:phosphoribosylanthranilate isomerase